jgi:hypothetical protein
MAMHITQIANTTTMNFLVGRLMIQLRGDMRQLKGLSAISGCSVERLLMADEGTKGQGS